MADGADDRRSRSASAGARPPGASPLARLRSAAAPLFASSTRSPSQEVHTPLPVTASASVGVEDSLGARVQARHEATRRAAEKEKDERAAAVALAAAGSVELPQEQQSPLSATAAASASVGALLALAGGAPGGIADDDSVSLASHMSRAPHLVARDEALASANLSLFAAAFDDAGIERLEQAVDFSADELVEELKTCAAERGITVRRAHEKSVRTLHARLLSEAGAEAQTAQAPATEAAAAGAEVVGGVAASTPAVAPAPETTSAPAPAVANAGAFAKKHAKAARKKEREAAAVPTEPEARATKGPAAPGASSEALPGVDELLGRPRRVDEEPPTSEEAPRVEGASFADAECVPLTTHIFSNAWNPSSGRGAEQYLDTLLAATRGEYVADAEMKAEQLERIVSQCIDDGGLDLYAPRNQNPRSMRMAISAAWERVQAVEKEWAAERERRAAEAAKTTAKSSVHESSAPDKGAALVAAIAAAGMGRATSTKPTEANDEPTDASRDRVKAVAADKHARDLLSKLRKQGEAVLSSHDAEAIEAFIKAQADAQVGTAGIAELLHSSNLPTPKGVYADPDATISMLTGKDGTGAGEQLAACASVARDAEKVQEALLYVIERKMERKLAGGDAQRMAKAVLHGTIVPVENTTGAFKPKEMSVARSLGLIYPDAKKPSEAKELVEGLLDGLSVGLRIAHPHDRYIEDALSDAREAAVGPRRVCAYHNQVYGEMFKRYAKLWTAWDGGTGSVMPTMASAWAKASRNPHMIELLSGRIELEEMAKQATDRAERAEAAARDASARAAKPPKAEPKPKLPPGGPPLNQVSSAKLTLPPGAPPPVFKIAGEARRTYRRENLDPLFSKIRQAKADAKTAEDAGASDAAAKREAVKAIEAEIERHKEALAVRA